MLDLICSVKNLPFSSSDIHYQNKYLLAKYLIQLKFEELTHMKNKRCLSISKWLNCLFIFFPPVKSCIFITSSSLSDYKQRYFCGHANNDDVTNAHFKNAVVMLCLRALRELFHRNRENNTNPVISGIKIMFLFQTVYFIVFSC